MTLDSLDELAKAAVSAKEDLIGSWEENAMDTIFVPYHLRHYPSQVFLNNMRKNSIFRIQGLFKIANEKGFIGPDTILQYARFEDYLEKTNFSNRTATTKDMAQAKSLLDSFIAYASMSSTGSA